MSALFPDRMNRKKNYGGFQQNLRSPARKGTKLWFVHLKKVGPKFSCSFVIRDNLLDP